MNLSSQQRLIAQSVTLNEVSNKKDSVKEIDYIYKILPQYF